MASRIFHPQQQPYLLLFFILLFLTIAPCKKKKITLSDLFLLSANHRPTCIIIKHNHLNTLPDVKLKTSMLTFSF